MQIFNILAALLVSTSAVSALKLSGPVPPASLPKGRAGTYKKSVYTPPAAAGSRPKISKRAPYDDADAAISDPHTAVYVDVGSFGSVTIQPVPGREGQYIWVNGKSVIGSSGFAACHAIAIKVGLNVFVAHVYDWTTDLKAKTEEWAAFARSNGGRAWIWVPQNNGVDENTGMVADITAALGGLTTQKVTRERAQTVQASKMTAMAVWPNKIVMGTYEEKF